MKSFILMCIVLICSSAIINPIAAIDKPLPVIKKPDFKFVSQEYKVSINFPGAYEESVTEQKPDSKAGKTLKVNATVNDDVYFLGMTLHKVEMTGHVEMADVSLTSFAKAVNGEITDQKAFIYGTHEGKEATIYMAAQQKYVHYRVILVDNFQYQVLVVNNDKTLNSAALAFFNSFTLME